MINFQEIDWKTGDPWQDFAAEFLQLCGYRLDSPPSRGPDGGKDLLATEIVQPPHGQPYSFKWLVSCKHTAHSGKAVGTMEEYRITDAVRQHDADGLLGFYSVGPTTSLTAALAGFKRLGYIKDWRIYGAAEIERKIIDGRLDLTMFRFFPNSFLLAKGISMSFGEYLGLRCCYCNKDILKEHLTRSDASLIVYDTDLFTSQVVAVYPVCHDHVGPLETNIASNQRSFAFENFNTFLNPFVYSDKIRNQDFYVNNAGLSFTPSAKAQHDSILRAIGQYISVIGSTHDPREQNKFRSYYKSYSGIFGIPSID